MQARPGKSPLTVIVVVAVIVCGAALLYFRDAVPQHPTGPVNAILNNLRKIEGAKELWADKHGGAADVDLTAEDLAPFLPQDFWKRTVAGERYIISRPNVPPEAVLTRGVQDLPTGTRLRFGNEKVEEIRPNQSRQPTPGVRLAAYGASVARRGCAYRVAVIEDHERR